MGVVLSLPFAALLSIICLHDRVWFTRFGVRNVGAKRCRSEDHERDRKGQLSDGWKASSLTGVALKDGVRERGSTALPTSTFASG